MKTNQAFDINTKILLVVVGILGVGSLVYGGVNLYRQIFNPFRITIPEKDLSALVPQTAEQELAELRQMDSDEDALSDYDEIHIYNTSPYLPDSDSDGIVDIDEIRGGTDPNCALGEDCQGVRLVLPDTKISDLFPQFSDSETTLKDKTIQEFRSILVDQGFDPDQLAAIDDETLLVVLEESLKVQDEEAGGSATEEPVDLDEARLFLIELGVPEDEVYSLSNQEIEDILNTFQ